MSGLTGGIGAKSGVIGTTQLATFSNNTLQYLNIGNMLIATGYTTSGASSSNSLPEGYYNYGTAVTATGFASQPMLFGSLITNYFECSVMFDSVSFSGSTISFRPFLGASGNDARSAALNSRKIHVLVIGEAL